MSIRPQRNQSISFSHCTKKYLYKASSIMFVVPFAHPFRAKTVLYYSKKNAYTYLKIKRGNLKQSWDDFFQCVTFWKIEISVDEWCKIDVLSTPRSFVSINRWQIGAGDYWWLLPVNIYGVVYWIMSSCRWSSLDNICAIY